MISSAIKHITSKIHTPLYINEVFKSSKDMFTSKSLSCVINEIMKMDSESVKLMFTFNDISKHISNGTNLKLYVSNDMIDISRTLNSQLLLTIYNNYRDDYIVGLHLNIPKSKQLTTSFTIPSSKDQLDVLEAGLTLFKSIV